MKKNVELVTITSVIEFDRHPFPLSPLPRVVEHGGSNRPTL